MTYFLVVDIFNCPKRVRWDYVFVRCMEDVRIKTLVWPSRSPDLTPIKYGWDNLKHGLRRQPALPETLKDSHTFSHSTRIMRSDQPEDDEPILLQGWKNIRAVIRNEIVVGFPFVTIELFFFGYIWAIYMAFGNNDSITYCNSWIPSQMTLKYKNI